MNAYEKRLQARTAERVRIAKEGGDVQAYLRNERNKTLTAAAKAETQGKDYQTAHAAPRSVQTPELDKSTGNGAEFTVPKTEDFSAPSTQDRKLTNEEQAREIMGLLNPVDFSPEAVAERNPADGNNVFNYAGRMFAGGAANSLRGIANDISYSAQRTVPQQTAENAIAAYRAGVKFPEAEKAFQEYMDSIPQNQRDAMEITGTLPTFERFLSDYVQKNTATPELKKAVSWGENYNKETAELYPERQGSVIGDVAAGLGGMVPAIAASFVPGVGGFLGKAAMFSSARGNAIQQAIDNGASYEDAEAYGTAVGGIELATEALFGGLGKIGKKLVGKGVAGGAIEKYITSHLANNPTVSKAITRVINGLGEGAEEYLSEWGGWMADKATIQQDERSAGEVSEDAAYSFFVGTLISGFMQASDLMSRGQSAQEAMETAAETETPVADAVDLLTNPGRDPQRIPGTRSHAEYTLASPARKARFEQESGIKLTGTKAEQRNAILQYYRNAQAAPEPGAVTSDTQQTGNPLYDAIVAAQESRPIENPLIAPESPLPAQEAQTPTPAAEQTAEADTSRSTPRPAPEFNPERRSDAEVDAIAAQRIAADRQGELEYLFSGDARWDDADTVTAQRILSEEVAKAEETGDYSTVAKLREAWKKEGTIEGRAFRQRGRFNTTPEAIIADAAAILYGPNTQLRKMPPKKKAEIMRTVKAFTREYAQIQEGNTPALIDLIKRLNEKRRTTGLFRKHTSKAMSAALDYFQKAPDGDAFLREVATTQISRLASDYQKVSAANAFKDLRVMSMLSKLGTVARNLVSNNIFDPIETIANDISLPLDMLLSRYTGTRSLALDKSWFSDAKRRGAKDGFLRSFVREGLDAAGETSTSRYDTTGARTFKMTGGVFERILSTWQKYENYALRSTDELQKGGIAAEANRGFQELRDRGKIKPRAMQDQGQRIAEQRTLQEKNRIARGALKIRGAINDVASVTDSVGGSVGLGDLSIPFATVPTNVGVQGFNYTPGGFAKGVVQLADVLISAKNKTLTPEAQANAVMNLGRSLTGAGLSVLGAVLAVKGLLIVGEDEDKDKAATDRATGIKGLQLNLSAIKRAFSGENDGIENGDVLMDVGFLEQIAVPLMLGAALADDLKDSGQITAKDVAEESAQSLYEIFMGMPTTEALANAIDTYKYSAGSTTGEKMLDAVTSYAADAVSPLLVPNFVRGMAQGFDDTVRDIYGGETAAEDELNYLKAGIPGLRQTLPASLDPWGREQQYTGNPLYDALNANILPGAVSIYQQDSVTDEIARLYETGEAGVYPDRYAPYSVEFDKETYDLTPEERRTYLETMGKESYAQMQDIFRSGLYRALSTEEQAEAVRAIESYAAQLAKREFLESRGVDYEGDAEKLAAMSDPAAYLTFREAWGMATAADESRDYSAMETLAEFYADMPEDVREALKDYDSKLPHVADAYTEDNVPPEAWYKTYDAVKALSPPAGYKSPPTWQQMQEVIRSTPARYVDALMGYYLDDGPTQRYDTARSFGVTAKEYADIYAAYSQMDGKDENGKSIPYLKQKRFYAWAENQGYNEAQAEYMYKLFSVDLKDLPTYNTKFMETH